MARRTLPRVVLLAAALHAVGMARSPLPAQDGLKFLRIARQFQAQPWADVVRSADQHPLYPALIALAQPAVSAVVGEGPTSWRLAAQGVSTLATLALLLPLYYFARDLFDARTATLAALLLVVLPLPAEVGHDSLSDPLALLGLTLAAWLGSVALRTHDPRAALGSGLAAGLGFLARPEVAVLPVAVIATAVIGRLAGRRRPVERPVPKTLARLAPLPVAFLAIVGAYALVKGEVSEKLAVRLAVGLPSNHAAPHRSAPAMPPGLDDPRWDFSPKEETGRAARPLGLAAASGRVLAEWAEGLAWVGVPLLILGVCRVPTSEQSRPGRMMAVVYAGLFAAILVRHAMTLGYLSGRHVLSLLVLSLPWVSAGALAGLRRIGERRDLGIDRRRRLERAGLAALVVAGVLTQARPGHPSRRGHLEAGRWLAAHAAREDAVLDTRGWAAFVSGRNSYDYWHVRQALTDAHLAYVVVGSDELACSSRRAATLRAVLAFATEPVAAFPGRDGHPGDGVQIFRFRRPASWEGLRP